MDYKQAYEELQDQMRWDRIEADRQRQEEYDERQRVRKQEDSEYWLTADSWNEAFRKGIQRYQNEADEETEWNQKPDIDDFGGKQTWFTEQLEQIKAARVLFNQENAKVQERINRIRARAERMIQAIEQDVRDGVADAIDAQFDEECLISEFLREDNYTGLVDW